MWTRRSLLASSGCLLVTPQLAGAADTQMVLDDLSNPGFTSLGTPWNSFTDRVMGGLSDMSAELTEVEGRRAMRMVAEVTTANNGGFAQIAASLGQRGLNASGFRALELDIWGNDEVYEVHLRTPACRRPWQYYRHTFSAPARWSTVRLRLDKFEPISMRGALDTTALRRIGIVAYGRDFMADLSIARVAFIG